MMIKNCTCNGEDSMYCVCSVKYLKYQLKETEKNNAHYKHKHGLLFDKASELEIQLKETEAKLERETRLKEKARASYLKLLKTLKENK